MLSPSEAVPHLPGCYALIHRLGRYCFVGHSSDLHSRWLVWRSILSRSLASQQRRGFPDLPMGEWEFKIILTREGVTEAELEACVEATMAKAARQGFQLLNKHGAPPTPSTAPVFDARAYHLSQMPVPIHDEDGQPMTYTEAAQAIGRTVDAVKNAAKRVREQHPGQPINMDQLRATRTRNPRR